MRQIDNILAIVYKIKNNLLWNCYYKHSKLRFFNFNGQIYKLFLNDYNHTYENERAVEIPIIWEMVRKYNEKQILEIGNVCSHYFNVSHDIVDKYEIGKGVINEDVVDFNPPKKYDLIISISTLEHVGWDETPKDPMKIIDAINQLKNLMAPNGKMIITLPLGYNPQMDGFLKEGKIKFTKTLYLNRINKNNDWVQVTKNIIGAKYGCPYNNANALVIGIIE